ncbi:MAG: hypothetical protein GX606_02210 [Elusimicrobia bacterium]|nr:hypothetical protein [Elusimicrobiota bacterium]
MREKGLERHDGFLRRIFDSRAFDIISTHDYYFPDQAVNGFTFGSYLDHIKALAAEYGVADRPLWVTENGYVTVPTKVGARMDPGSIGAQSRWLEGAVVQASDAGVDRMFWMLIADRDEPYFGTMGLLENDGTSRPVCAVVRRVNEGGVKLDQR